MRSSGKLGWAGATNRQGDLPSQVGSVHRRYSVADARIAPARLFDFDYLGNIGTVSSALTAALGRGARVPQPATGSASWASAAA